MNNLVKTLSLMLLLIFATGCAATGSYPSGESRGDVDKGRLIIQSGNLHVEVDDTKNIGEQVATIIKEKNGYVFSSRLSADNKFYATLKVPAKDLNAAMNAISSLGNEESRSVTSDDVTADFVDKEAELNNLISLRARMRDLLSKATTVEEILRVEEELNRIQTRIDTINGRLKVLSNQVEYSNLNLTITEKRIYGPLGYIGIGIIWVIEKLFVIK